MTVAVRLLCDGVLCIVYADLWSLRLISHPAQLHVHLEVYFISDLWAEKGMPTEYH